MLDNFKMFLNDAFMTAYDGEETNTPEDAGKDDSTKDQTSDGGKKNEKVLPQSKVDEIVKERLAREAKKFDDEKNKLASELEELKSRLTLTDSEKEQFSDKIANLKNEKLSVEERFNKEVKRLETELDLTKKTLSDKVSKAEQRYETYRKTQELHTAAMAADARKPFQLVELLLPKTSMEEVMDEHGKPTGELEVKVSVRQKKEDGTYFETKLPVADALNVMRDNIDDWGNQFNSKEKNGLDMIGSASTPVSKEMPTDFEKYKNSAWRQKTLGASAGAYRSK